MKKYPSLQRRLITSFAVLISIFALFAVLLSFFFNAQLENEIPIQQAQQTRNAAARIESILDISVKNFNQLSLILSDNKSTKMTHSQSIALFHSLNRSFDFLELLDNEGRVKLVSPQREDIIGLDFSYQEFFTTAEQEATLMWSDAFISNLSGHIAATLSIRIPNGVLVGQMDLRPLSDLLDKHTATEDAFTAIVDQRGAIIAHSNKMKIMEGEDLRSFSVLQKGLQGFNASGIETWHDSQGFASVTPIARSGWTLISFDPAEASMGNLNRIQRVGFAILLVALILGFIAAYQIQRRFMAPLERLQGNFQQLIRGEYPSGFSPEYEEFENSTTCFSVMAKELHEREVALQTSHNEYRELAENIPDMLIRYDRNVTPIYKNRNAALVFELLSASPSTSSTAPLDSMTTLSQWLEEPHKVLTTGLFAEREYRCSLGGENRFFNRRFIPELDSAGVIRSLLEVTRDVTNEHALEDRLRQSEKLQAIGQLAGGIAHDFNNQLTGILGAAEILLIQIENHQIRRYIDTIKNCAERAASLTRQLLAFARKGARSESPIDVHKCILEVVSVMEHTIDKNVELSTLLEAVNPIVLGDAPQLETALLNLGINSRDAMPNGGKIQFLTKNLILNKDATAKISTDLKPGAYLLVIVRDNGSGMAPESLRHIFEPFFTTKELGKGTGLGLSAVYGALRYHGGAITVESKVGVGTEFSLYIPSAIQSRIEDDNDASVKTLATNPKVLLVDDEKNVREVVGEMLKLIGGDVAGSFGNGRDAIHFYKDNWQKIDLVILDIVMPEINGIETLSHLRQINPQVRAAFASGYGAEQITQADKDGIMKNRLVLQKPFSKKRLAETIEKLLS